jgi:hypothetical protein
LLNLRTGRVLGLLTRSRDKTTNLGGWAVHTLDALAQSSEFSGLAVAYRGIHEQETRWRDARHAVGIGPSQRRRLIVGWAADVDADFVRDALAEVLATVEGAWPPPGGTVRQLQHAPATSGHQAPDPSEVANRSHVAVLVSDSLDTSAACMQLGRAAARGGTPVVVLSPGPPSANTSIAIIELDEMASDPCSVINIGNDGLQAALTPVLFQYALLVERQAAARSAGASI